MSRYLPGECWGEWVGLRHSIRRVYPPPARLRQGFGHRLRINSAVFPVRQPDSEYFVVGVSCILRKKWHMDYGAYPKSNSIGCVLPSTANVWCYTLYRVHTQLLNFPIYIFWGGKGGLNWTGSRCLKENNTLVLIYLSVEWGYCHQSGLVYITSRRYIL